MTMPFGFNANLLAAAASSANKAQEADKDSADRRKKLAEARYIVKTAQKAEQLKKPEGTGKGFMA